MSDRSTLRKEVVVNATQEKAFRVFTHDFDSWWPRTHHIGASEMKEAILEPKLNGRWYEKMVNGAECDWGKVIAWEPHHRFVVTWQLTREYTFDADFITEVEVTFDAIDQATTRVTLEHKYLDRYGEAGQNVVDSISSEAGWEGLLKLFGAVVSGNDKLRDAMAKRIALDMEQ